MFASQALEFQSESALKADFQIFSINQRNHVNILISDQILSGLNIKLVTVTVMVAGEGVPPYRFHRLNNTAKPC